MTKLNLGANRRVLLADDNEEMSVVIAGMLDMLCCDVDRARNGLEALDMADARTYSAILMDVEMPVMDGLTSTRSIRSHESAALSPPVPIVGITGHTDPGTHKLCRLAGMDDVLRKPFQMEQLEATLDAVMAKREN